jgi:hypothetical protein
MEFALSESNERIVATPHAKGFCALCKGPMIPKCGHIKIDHWAHKSVKDCDPWWEPESEWHRQWKNIVHEDLREVVIEKEGEKHRADIQLPSGIIIEFQKSPLPIGERLRREKFYEKMLWVIHFPKEKIEWERSDPTNITSSKNFNEYYLTIKYFNKWINYPPNLSPIFLDFDDGEMFWIMEFYKRNFSDLRTTGLIGKFINKKEFVNLYLRTLFFDLEKLKISHRHCDFLESQKMNRFEAKKKHEEGSQQSTEEFRKQELRRQMQVELEERLIREKPRKNKIIEPISDTIEKEARQAIGKRDQEYIKKYLNGKNKPWFTMFENPKEK